MGISEKISDKGSLFEAVRATTLDTSHTYCWATRRDVSGVLVLFQTFSVITAKFEWETVNIAYCECVFVALVI